MTEDEPPVLPVAADITDLKRAEEIRAHYAAIVESSDDAIVAKNLDGVISAWNAAAQRMFGYSEQRGHRPADHDDHSSGPARGRARHPEASSSR